MDLFSKSKVMPKIVGNNDNRVPDGMFLACPYCGKQLYSKELGEYRVCPECDYGFRISARERIALLTSDFVEQDADLMADDDGFPGYADKLQRARQQTGLNDSVLTGIGTVGAFKTAIAIMDSYFIMGSLGTITGEKITRLIERSTRERLPVVLFAASGGARMQEGIHSLMQMAKVSAALAEHHEAGLAYIIVLTDPTMGGVTASFAMDGDITLAEPHALIGFAGRRVIEQTIHEKLPDDFQRAETLLANGFVDAIVPRQAMTETLAKLLKLHSQL
jgi:acetyl-CoA carboxylase carboxyl transferase subunit beta